MPKMPLSPFSPFSPLSPLPPHPTRWLTSLLAALLLLLAACGGGSGEPAAPVVIEPEGPGRTLAVTPLRTFTTAEVSAALAALGEQAPAVPVRHAVQTWRIDYLTLDADGREQRASGLLAVPLKPAGRRSPVLSYQHATIFLDAEAPSNALAAGEPPILLAATGYVVAAADYLGYGVSKGFPHPYLLSAPSASAVLDLLTAARNWRLRNGVAGNGQLFLAGYSEGGYVTMAAHRALQAAPGVHRDELVATVPGGGPYHLAATLDALLELVRDDYPLLGALIDPGFLRRLGNDVRDEVRRQLVRALLPGNADVAFDTRFIDPYLADDRDLIERQSNVHDWRPEHRVRLFHGRDDRTVPYVSGSSTLQALHARGAPDVSMTDCAAVPAGHLECVPGYWRHLLTVLGAQARDL